MGCPVVVLAAQAGMSRAAGLQLFEQRAVPQGRKRHAAARDDAAHALRNRDIAHRKSTRDVGLALSVPKNALDQVLIARIQGLDEIVDGGFRLRARQPLFRVGRAVAEGDGIAGRRRCRTGRGRRATSAR